nr:tRNA (N(6)-L-threonylcarbamoyladenosine(37)-C(2))-methylthiotransferase MtaB [Phaeovibrio sulfidiphilus]
MVVGFGCRLNASESRMIREQCTLAGAHNAVVINTCAVTREAERQARQTIRRLRRENPDALMIVTGCAPQIDPSRWESMPEVDRVLGNREKLHAHFYREALDARSQRVQVASIAEIPEDMPPFIRERDGRFRAFVHIQQGCDHACTFCVVPLARGPGYSLPKDHILEQIRLLVADGVREIVLSGVDVASWGREAGASGTLGDLVRHLLDDLPDLERLRLSSLDPVILATDSTLFDLLTREPRIMGHLHLSVQSGSDLILKRMRRRHRRALVVDTARRLRDARPDLALGADLIAGFPTESEDDFRQTLELIGDAGLSHLHIFPYSPRPGTKAALIPGLDPGLVKDRARLLRERADQAFRDFLHARIGSETNVLVEKPGFGHAEEYFPVRLEEDAALPGDIVRVCLEPDERDGASLFGKVISKR